MILNDDQVLNILEALEEQTVQHKASWYSEGEKLWIDLPNRVTIELSQPSEGKYAARIKRDSDELLGMIDSDRAKTDGNGDRLKALYEAASGEASRSIYAEIIDSIKFTSSATAAVLPKVPKIREVSAEKAAEVLKKMAGRWHLDYSDGEETVEIREGGTYYVVVKNKPTFAFNLVVVAVNDATNAVEVAKDRPDGRRRQIEYLTLAENSMKGHAKHDGHKLVYTRIK